jgi:uncharacterized protein YceH (UPF0502 family)
VVINGAAREVCYYLLVSLSQIEVRVLAALLEKERTTPEAYPLTTNSLLLACNQKSNRDPVTNYGLLEVEETLRNLADKGLIRKSTPEAGERSAKYLHNLQSVLSLRSPVDLAVLAVLMLRGAQTAGELRTNTARYNTRFATPAEVERSLERLAAHQPPLVRNQGRSAGQSQDRWIDTFSPDPDRHKPRVRMTSRS